MHTRKRIYALATHAYFKICTICIYIQVDINTSLATEFYYSSHKSAIIPDIDSHDPKYLTQAKYLNGWLKLS